MQISKSEFERVVGYRFTKKETEHGVLIEMYQNINDQWKIVKSWMHNVFSIHLDEKHNICFNVYDKEGQMHFIKMENPLKFTQEQAKQILDKLING